jgi:hypothetical protein
MRSRWLAVIAAVLLLVVAAGLFVLAADVRRWERTLAQDDLVFREAPGDPELFEAQARLGGAARVLLGIDDDLAFRDALQLFWASVASPEVERRAESADLRRAAELALAGIAHSDPDPKRRSQVTNVLGVLSVAGLGSQLGAASGARFESAIMSFRSAILLDDGNEDAKFNLELVLRRRPPGDDVNLPRGVVGRGDVGRSCAGY